jgi:hypothetical protein
MPELTFHGCFSRFAGDASEPIDFLSNEWTKVRNKKRKGKEEKRISKSECNWKIAKSKAKLEVAPKDDNAYLRKNEQESKQKMKKSVQSKPNNLKPSKLKNHISNLTEQDIDLKLKELLKNEIKLHQENEKVESGLKSVKVSLKRSMDLIKAQKKLYLLLLEFEMNRSSIHWNNTLGDRSFHNIEPNPLHEAINKTMNKINKATHHLCLLEDIVQGNINHLQKIHNDRHDSKRHYDNYHCLNNGFIDHYGNIHEEHQPYPNEDYKCYCCDGPCRSIPKYDRVQAYLHRQRLRYQKAKLDLETEREMDKMKHQHGNENLHCSQGLFQNIPSYHDKRTQRKINLMKAKLQEQLKQHIESKKEHKNLLRRLQLLQNREGYEQSKRNIARKINNNITESVWNEKEIIRNKQKINKLRQRQGYSRIERAFMALDEDPLLTNVTASVINATNSDETNDTTATTPPSNDVPNIVNLNGDSLEEFLRELQTSSHLMDELERQRAEFDEERERYINETKILFEESNRLRKANDDARDIHEHLRNEMHNQVTTQDRLLQLIRSQQHTTSTDISSPVKRLLDKYYSLDDSSKQALWNSAMTTNNIALQHALFKLQDDVKNRNNPVNQAKLANELIKLADTYKMPELKFDEQAKKHRYNYHTWITKLRSILAMFSHTSSVLCDDEIIPFDDSECIGNKALYLLIGSRVDGYFQRIIKQFEGKGDKSLELLKSQCANINALYKDHFHHLFTSIRIRDSESATSYLRRFTYAKTEAEGAGNVYTTPELVAFILSGLSNTKNMKYETAIQLYNLEMDNRKTFTLEEIKTKFFSIDKKIARDQALTRLAIGSAARGHLQSKCGTEPRSNHRRKHNNRSVTNRTRNEHANSASHSTVSAVTCYNCGETGHYASNCTKKKQQQASRPGNAARGNVARGTVPSNKSTDSPAIVCAARALHLAHAMSARRIIEYCVDGGAR